MVKTEEYTELMELTGTKTRATATEAAILFTLMHDKASVRDALKELKKG